MKTLKRVLVAASVLAVLLLAVDFLLHPAAYLPAVGPHPESPALHELPPPPSGPFAPNPTAVPTPTENAIRPTEAGASDPSWVMSPLDLQAVHDLIRDREEEALQGQAFEWTFHRVSPFLWSPLGPDGSAPETFLSFEGRGGRWFAMEVPPDDPKWDPHRLSAGLQDMVGEATGVFVGVHRAAPTGADWSRLKRVPLIRPLKTSLTERGEQSEAPIEDPEVPVEATMITLEQSPRTAMSPIGRNPAYRIVEVRRDAFNDNPEFERCAPWSLTHLLYQNGRWLLSENDYERVEEWDRMIRNQFDTFESPFVRQAVVADFVRLLGYTKARVVGVVFNGADGFPGYRWSPDPSNDRPETEESTKQTESTEEASLTDGLEDLLEIPDRPAAVQDRLLEFLLSPEKSIVGGALQRMRQDWIWIRPWGNGDLFGAAGGSGSFSALTDLLDLTEAEEIVFRIRPVWFDDVETRFGPADSLRTEPYPRTIPGAEIAPSVQKVSIVWHVYGGVRVGKANGLVEGEEGASDSVVAAIDVAKHRRLNRPMGLSQKAGQ